MSPPQRIRYPGAVGPVIQGAAPGQLVSIPSSGGGADQGAIPQRAILNATQSAPVSGSYSTLLTLNLTVVGGASKILVLASLAGVRTAAVGTVRVRVQVDGTNVGNGLSGSLLGTDGLSMILPALAGGALSTPGAHTITLLWRVDIASFTINNVSPIANLQNASLFAREVPA